MFVLFQLSGELRRVARGGERRSRTAWLGVSLAGALLVVAGCGQKTAANNPAGAGSAMPVQVQAVKSVTIPDTTEYLSVLKSRHSANINPQVEGQVIRIFVK